MRAVCRTHWHARAVATPSRPSSTRSATPPSVSSCTALAVQTGMAGDRARRIDDPARRADARVDRVGADLRRAGRVRGRTLARRRGGTAGGRDRAGARARRGAGQARRAADRARPHARAHDPRGVSALARWRVVPRPAPRSSARTCSSRSCNPTAATAPARTSNAGRSARSPRRRPAASRAMPSYRPRTASRARRSPATGSVATLTSSIDGGANDHEERTAVIAEDLDRRPGSRCRWRGACARSSSIPIRPGRSSSSPSSRSSAGSVTRPRPGPRPSS